MPKKSDIIIINIGGASEDTESATTTKEIATVEKPRKYNVVMHNDEVTPMGFVVEVLVGIFNMKRTDAIELMLTIHNVGKGIAGTYPKSIADAKLLKTREVAEKAGFDEFKVTLEKA